MLLALAVQKVMCRRNFSLSVWLYIRYSTELYGFKKKKKNIQMLYIYESFTHYSAF